MRVVSWQGVNWTQKVGDTDIEWASVNTEWNFRFRFHTSSKCRDHLSDNQIFE